LHCQHDAATDILSGGTTGVVSGAGLVLKRWEGRGEEGKGEERKKKNKNKQIKHIHCESKNNTPNSCP